MDCFGVCSLFCMTGDKCRHCEKFQECLKACYAELKELDQIGDVKILLKRHLKLMQSFNLAPAEDIKATKQTSSNEVAALCNALTDANLISEGAIAKDISEAPHFFQTGVEFLYKLKETTDEKFVRHLKDRLLNTDEHSKEETAIKLAAVTVQTLAKFKIIKVVGHKIIWIAKSTELAL